MMLNREEDMETGEPCLDAETGEEVAVTARDGCPSSRRFSPPPPPPPQQQSAPPPAAAAPTDAETGEPAGQRASKKRPFQIPKSVLRKEDDSHMDLSHSAFVAQACAHAAPKGAHMNCLQHKVERSTNMSPILFMLPTVFLFPAWASVLLIVFELICHAYVHNKNKRLPRTSNLVYRSPLHLITSVFCAYCQSDKLMVKIGKMQDERLLRTHRKQIAYCTYVERMSVVT